MRNETVQSSRPASDQPAPVSETPCWRAANAPFLAIASERGVDATYVMGNSMESRSMTPAPGGTIGRPVTTSRHRPPPV